MSTSFTALEQRTVVLLRGRDLAIAPGLFDTCCVYDTKGYVHWATPGLLDDRCALVSAPATAEPWLRALLVTGRGRQAHLDDKVRAWAKLALPAAMTDAGKRATLYAGPAFDLARQAMALRDLTYTVLVSPPVYWPRLALLDWMSALVAVELEELSKLNLTDIPAEAAC